MFNPSISYHSLSHLPSIYLSLITSLPSIGSLSYSSSYWSFHPIPTEYHSSIVSLGIISYDLHPSSPTVSFSFDYAPNNPYLHWVGGSLLSWLPISYYPPPPTSTTSTIVPWNSSLLLFYPILSFLQPIPSTNLIDLSDGSSFST